VAGRVGDPGRADLHRPGADADLALAGVAVAVASEVVLDALVAAPAEIAVDLGVEGPLEHPPGALAGQLLERLADRGLAARDGRFRSSQQVGRGRGVGWRLGRWLGRRCREGDRFRGVIRCSHGVSFWGFNNTGRVRRLFVPSTPRGRSGSSSTA